MNVESLHNQIRIEVSRRAYIIRVEILEQTRSILKARLYLTENLFVQIYRNDRFSTISLALIADGQRIYARDELNGKWHRHALPDPELHDKSSEGSRPITDLAEFLDEVETILSELDLP